MEPSNKQITKMAKPSVYADALAAGQGVLRCLPLELRQDVFAFAALNYVQSGSRGLVEAADISERVHEWLPPMCHVSDDFFFESLPMFLRHIDIVVREAYTAYSLYFFLRATNTFAYIYSLQFRDAAILVPLFAGPQLVKQCINLRHVLFTFEDENVRAAHRHKDIGATGPFVLDKKAFLEGYAFRQLLSLKHIEKVGQHCCSRSSSPLIRGSH
ncbi:hypothetical protein BU23DRAFT_166169 [Bimuria novae-zelandiae CBS 107.79]|uniref:Uncharacterized protein n=1 Tax=Bimuria novae-zelandiae CBS 107.79 TaxID=1447943 RepID=A0A6A5V3S9_9PLEO|nr:hypothetical protein BU23DRAFT_166169 [Bimuria novae-zelandiae CBS 107.79]